MSRSEPPPMLGPFRTRGSQYESESGAVLNGEAPDGRAVELVQLGPGPSSDPAARDRFRASVALLDAQLPGSVLAADLDSPSPWVALTHGVSGVAAPTGGSAFPSAGPATQLLAAAVPPGFQAVPPHGPQFSPYWRGRRAVDGARAGVVAIPAVRWRRWALAAFVLLVLLLLWWLLSRPVVQVPQPTPTPVPTVPLLPPTPSMPGSGSPSPVPSGFQSDVPVLLHPLFVDHAIPTLEA